MSEARAPWPSFAADARAVLEKRLKPLGLVFEEGSNTTSATFAGPGGRVALAYDPRDVLLEAKVNGIWLTQLLEQLGSDVEKPEPSKTGLVALAKILAVLLPQLATTKGKKAAKEASKWQSILTGDDPVAMRRALENAPKASVRAAAARRVTWMAKPSAVIAKSLARALDDADPSVRLAAVEALYDCAASAPTLTVPALARALDDANADMRARALLALRQIGPRARSAKPAVMERLKRGDKRERTLAEEVLRAISAPR